MIWW